MKFISYWSLSSKLPYRDADFCIILKGHLAKSRHPNSYINIERSSCSGILLIFIYTSSDTINDLYLPTCFIY